MDNGTNNQMNNEPNNQMNNEPNNQMDYRTIKKKHTPALIVILLVCTVVLASRFVNNMMNGSIFGYNINVDIGSGNSYDIDQHKTFDFTNEKILVKSVSTNVKVIVEDRKDIKADFFGEIQGNSDTEPELIIEKTSNEIKIHIDYHNNFNVNDEAQFDVYIPKSFAGQFKIEAVSASVKTTGLKAEALSVECISGAVELSEVEANNKLNVKTVSGDISVTDTTSDGVTISSISGDVKAEGSFGEMNMNTVSGNIEVLVDKLKGINKIKTISGEFQLDIPNKTSFGFDLKSVSGDIDISEDSDIVLSETKEHVRKGVSGNSSDIYLEVETVSGDIEIE